MVIVDEISSFRNHKSQRYKALRKVRPFIKRIIGLTGTPTSSSSALMDLWSEVSLLDMGKRLGRFISRYRETYLQPGQYNPYTGVVYSYELLLGAKEKIYEKIADMTISMKALDYLDMPEKVIVQHEAVMDKAERRLYDEMKRDLVASIDGEDITATNAAVLSGKLLQMASGAVYNEDHDIIEIHDKKLLMLEDLIEQANGQKVLIAYYFKHDHERIMRHLTELGYSPRDVKTSEDIDAWNDPDSDFTIGLISPQSAGHGLNLQKSEAHILIYFSQIWSLELVQQTNARLWRQGQKNTVTIHHIICKDTVDEDVMRALENKNTTQQSLINAVKARLT